MNTDKRKRQASLKGARGFTLVELMVALVILAMGLFSIIHLQVVSVRGNAYARERTDAYQIAMAVEEDLRRRALEWVDNSVAADPAFAAIFPDLVLGATPALGDPIDQVADLHALQNFNGQVISADSAPASAQAVNIYGLNSVSSPNLDGARDIFRIHYAAHNVDLGSGLGPDPDVVRMTLFVSWDNKDHGRQDVDWAAWYTVAGFFSRHMVSVTFYLRRSRNW